MARSNDREEADRARAILLSLEGWTSERIAVAFCLSGGARHSPWLTVEWLPKYAPELNDIERSWRDLKRHFLAHRTFTDPDHLDRTIHEAIVEMNRERQTPVCTNLRIAA